MNTSALWRVSVSLGLPLCLAALLAACSSTPKKPEDCKNLDWRAVGAQAATNGRPADAGWQRSGAACQKLGAAADETAYRQGWARGQADYCTPRNAVRQGRNGNSYQGICPKVVAPNGHDTFVAAHELGRLIRQADAEVSDLESDLQSAESTLRSTKASEADKRVAATRARSLPLAIEQAKTRRSQLEQQGVANGWGVGR